MKCCNTDNAETDAYAPEPRRIIIRMPNWVGDAVMAVPALQTLRGVYPNAFLAVLAHPRVVNLLSPDLADQLLLVCTGGNAWTNQRETVRAVRETGILHLNGTHPVPFREGEHLLFRSGRSLPR